MQILIKQNVIQLLKTIKSVLPQPNLLPTTWKGVLKVLGKTCLSRTTFLCSICHQQCIKTKYGIKKCMNNNCLLYTKKLKSNEIVEIVNFDVRSQIQSIVRRNISVLSHQELFPKSDICYGSRYQQVSMQQRNPITIILHSDGAPLIKTSKQSLSPCLASIAELPPPIREYQMNIIIVALWSSRKRPNVVIFLEESVKEFKYLMKNETSLFINERGFNIILLTQYFVSDLPAKALFCNTINFNGYYACSCCCTKGTTIGCPRINVTLSILSLILFLLDQRT